MTPTPPTTGTNPTGMGENPFGDDPFGDGPFDSYEDPTTGERSPVPGELTDGLNDEQRRAVTCLDGDLVVIAGPGSGKTRVLTHRIAALVATGAALPRQILAVTFTNKAAGEMRHRLESLVGQEALGGMWVATFHSACLRLLRANAAAAGLPVGFNIVDADDARKVMRDVLSSLGLAAEQVDAKRAHATVSAAKNAGGIELLHDWEPWLVQPAVEYQRRLTLMGAVDFDDILGKTNEMLINHPHVLARYRKKFRHILVDEYQDTNLVQHRLLAQLSGGSSSFCVVGDADQSIYGWRSADPTFMLDMSTRPDATVVVLGENYRSTPQILETCQAIIENNPAPLRPALRTANPDGAPVRYVVCNTDRTEAEFVVGEVTTSRAATRAILMRTNAQTRPFEELLAARAEPYAVVGALRFYDRAEVKDALAYLRLAVNPRDLVSFARVVNTPRRGLGQVALEQIVNHATSSGAAVMEIVALACEDNRYGGRVTKGLTTFRDAYRSLVEAIALGPDAALTHVVRDLGLADHWRKDEDGGDRVQNLAELVSAAKAFCESERSVRVDGVSVATLGGYERTVAFLENVALVAGNTDDADKSRAVQLMTVHAAKGKEFEDVWVVGVEDSLFPHYLPGERPDAPEETRLLFVACSRAQRRLAITRAERRLVFGNLKENAESPLLRALPKSVERAHEGGDGPVGSWRSSSSFVRNGGRGWQTQTGERRSAAPPTTRLSPSDAISGVWVRHAVFGDGEITGVDGTTVTVQFPDTTRDLNITFAPLERI